MKRSLYNMALAICTAAAMYSCSLDEYNPSDTSGEGELNCRRLEKFGYLLLFSTL